MSAGKTREFHSAARSGFAQRLAETIGETPVSRFARRCDVSESLLRKYLGGDTLPGIDKLVNIADGAGVSIEWLATGRGSPRSGAPPLTGATDDVDGTGFVVPPHYQPTGPLGADAPVPGPQTAFSREWLRRALGVHPPAVLAFTVGGDAMEPSLADGDLVLVDTGRTEPTEDTVYLLRRHGALVVKRLQRCQDGSVLIRSDNEAYAEERVPAGNDVLLDVVGRVVWTGGRL